MSMFDDPPVCPRDCLCGRWHPCPGYVPTFWDVAAGRIKIVSLRKGGDAGDRVVLAMKSTGAHSRRIPVYGRVPLPRARILR